jgi:hypothetical protein
MLSKETVRLSLENEGKGEPSDVENADKEKS